MNLLERFRNHGQVSFNGHYVQNKKFILAVSGGIDSTVLTDLFFNTDMNFVIAHCNFQLRGDESERDELFVKELAKKYKKEIFIKRFETNQYAENNKISIQEAARELRYNWFKELQVTHSAFLATAHNADDNIETSLMFFLRGSGIHGLTGMREFDEKRKIIRPLLFATREDILQYAKENEMSWVEDSSNTKNKYTRNFLRNMLIPSIKEYFPEVKNNIADNINRFREIEVIYDNSIQQYKKKLLEFKNNEIHIPILKLKTIKPLDTVIWEITKEYNFHSHQIEEIKKLFTADNSSFIQSTSHRIIKNRNWLIIAPNKAEDSAHILIEEINQKVRFKNGELRIEKAQTTKLKLQTSNNTAQLNAKEIQFPLLLRKWQQGDYFYPLGMRKKKKLSRFFIDQKLSATQKEKVWVIESNKKIIWIIGYRIDDRFKLFPSTKEILNISFTPA